MSNFVQSEIDINHETIGLIAACLTTELHEFAATRGISHASVQAQLSAIHSVFLSYADDFIKVSPVITSGASGLRARVTLDPVGYRRAAKAAKDCMAGGASSV
ncbi:hypothetical protein K3758_02500 [Sulfitobacter sp. W002]|uniref:hypothetical protein n=1 Tax=Sulfitobacter sp. W002 TaxID=2867024 RepID=UPI0021A295A5|nr:hypothetical protein [Sulfitobacter sp. W002]UWR30421.1 hypothetical protein K3758_02500 [Sulfitobacter sp. W002]